MGEVKVEIELENAFDRERWRPTTKERILNLLLPFIGLHGQEKFKDHMVIFSEKRAKWILTA